MKLFCGYFIHSISLDELRVEHGLMLINNSGIIIDIVINDNPKGEIRHLKTKHNLKDDDEIIILNDSQFLIPGFIDSHCIAPYILSLGVGNDMNLTDWLNKYTFQKENKFKDIEFAQKVYQELVRNLIKQGTTCSAYTTTIHLEATKALVDCMVMYGQRGYVAKSCIDVHQSACCKETTDQSLSSTIELIDYMDEYNQLIQPMIAPRNSLYCSNELLKGLGELAKKHDLLIGTNFCQFRKASAKVGSNHTNRSHSSCLQILAENDLLNEKTILAQCLDLNDDEIKILKEHKVGISYCPLLNMNIMNGLLNSNVLVKQNGYSKVGLATYLCGGYSSSMLHSIVNALNTSKIVHFYETRYNSNSEIKSLSLANAFYQATLGNAKILHLAHKIGNFEVGKCFDALLIDTKIHLTNVHIVDDDSTRDKFEKFIYTGDDRNIVKIYIDGKLVQLD